MKKFDFWAFAELVFDFVVYYFCAYMATDKIDLNTFIFAAAMTSLTDVFKRKCVKEKEE